MYIKKLLLLTTYNFKIRYLIKYLTLTLPEELKKKQTNFMIKAKKLKINHRVKSQKIKNKIQVNKKTKKINIRPIKKITVKEQKLAFKQQAKRKVHYWIKNRIRSLLLPQKRLILKTVRELKKKKKAKKKIVHNNMAQFNKQRKFFLTLQISLVFLF